jgi:hypothetical protein
MRQAEIILPISLSLKPAVEVNPHRRRRPTATSCVAAVRHVGGSVSLTPNKANLVATLKQMKKVKLILEKITWSILELFLLQKSKDKH